MKQQSLILAALFLLTATGCATTGLNSSTGPGWVFSEFTEAKSVTSKQIGSKKGKACSQNIMGIVAIGDSSIIEAAKNGGIKTVATVDTETFRVIGAYGRSCTIVTGD